MKYSPAHCTRMSTMAAERSKLESLREICKMEKMSKGTPITKSVLVTARYILSTENGESKEFTNLVDKMNKCLQVMLSSVKKYKLIATKKEELWILFDKFSVGEGKKMCEEYNKTHNLPEASDFFWQLLMEKEFLYFVHSKLSFSVESEVVPAVSSQRQLTSVEENAIRYTDGFVLRKIEKKYECQKTDVDRQCFTASKAKNTQNVEDQPNNKVTREVNPIKQPSKQHQEEECVFLNNMSLTKPQCVCEDAVLVFAGPSQGCFNDENLTYLVPAREEFEKNNEGGRGSGLSQVVTGIDHEKNSKLILCSHLQTSYILSNPGDDPPKDWRK